MLNSVFSVFTSYVIPFATAAAVVVPCLSTLVSDHGERLILSYMWKLTNHFDLIYIEHTGTDYPLWLFPQDQPVRRAQ